MGKQKQPLWYYISLGLVIAILAFGWISESRIGTLPAVFASVYTFAMIGLVLRLCGKAQSDFWKIVAGIAIVLFYVFAGYVITGHWPHKGWSPD